MQSSALEHAAGYLLAASHATGQPSSFASSPWGPVLTNVVGEAWLASTTRGQLEESTIRWLRRSEPLLTRLLEFVPLTRLRQVYRSPLRSSRQVSAALHELQTASVLAEIARGIQLEVPTIGERRADFCVAFLSSRFHVEVKTHEDRSGKERTGGIQSVRALYTSALRQCSRETPNLLVLGRVQREAVERFMAEEHDASWVSAVVWLELVQSSEVEWRATFLPFEKPRHPFPDAQIEILRACFTRD